MVQPTGRTACGICGASVAAPFRPPAADLSPDLDFRPGEPARSTLVRWVIQCGQCGAAGNDLSRLTPGDRPAVEAARAEPPPSGPHSMRPHWLAGVIASRTGDTAAAFAGFLGAAWAADDATDTVAARRARERALEARPEAPGGQAVLTQLDVLRRAGRFEAADALAQSTACQNPDPATAAILSFQRARVAERDDGRHLLSSALRPPARTPHVLHGREAAAPGFFAPGFFGRLFGR